MRKFTWILLVLFILMHGQAWAAASAPLSNMMCPVMAGEPAKKKFHIDYQGSRIYFCCKPCVKAFEKDPEKYMENLKALAAVVPAEIS